LNDKNNKKTDKIGRMTEIVEIQKTPKLSIYAFKKGDDFFEKIKGFLLELGFRDVSGNLGNYVGDDLIIPNPKDMVDVRKQLRDDQYFIVFTFGLEKIYMIAVSQDDRQQEISDKLFKYFPVMKPDPKGDL